MAEYTCPTCNANSFDPCVTASGKPAKKRHAAFEKLLNDLENAKPESVGTIKDGEVKFEKLAGTETQKERFDRLKRENRAEKPIPLKVPTKASRRNGTSERQNRRKQGNHKRVRHGFMHRARRNALNAQVRAFWAPKLTDDVNAVA